MRTASSFIVATLALTLAVAAPAQAKSGLAHEKNINNGLLAVGIADEIRKRCNSIAGRDVRGLMFLQSLKNEARSKGYSSAEINAYVSSKSEKSKMRARGLQYLAQFGASPSDPASMCRVGRSEIAKQSAIGRFLRAK